MENYIDFIITNHMINNYNSQHIFNNELDITFMGPEVTQREFTILESEINKNIKDDNSVKYKYNSQGFRCDEFTDLHYGSHILFGGCSETEGVGGNIEDIWSHRLYSEINKITQLSGFYSIARGGYGWEKIIHNFRVYVKKYGFPEYFIVLLPNIGRFYEWDKDNGYWEYKQKYFEENVDSKDYLDKKTYMEKFIHFVNHWKLFQDFCESNNVKLIFSTWHGVDQTNFIKAKINNNMITLFGEELKEFIISKRPDGKIKNNDLRFRDGHSGILINEFRFLKFLEKFNEMAKNDKKNN